MLQLLANTGLGGSSPVFLDLTSTRTPLSHSVLPASALSTLDFTPYCLAKDKDTGYPIPMPMTLSPLD